MRLRLISTGIALAAILGWHAAMPKAHALVSDSYSGGDQFGGNSTNGTGVSDSYINQGAGLTWVNESLTSDSYQLGGNATTEEDGGEDTETDGGGSGGSSGGGGGGGNDGGGGRRPSGGTASSVTSSVTTAAADDGISSSVADTGRRVRTPRTPATSSLPAALPAEIGFDAVLPHDAATGLGSFVYRTDPLHITDAPQAAGSLRFFGAASGQGLHAAAPDTWRLPLRVLLGLLFLATLSAIAAAAIVDRHRKLEGKRRKKQSGHALLSMLAIAGLLATGTPMRVEAENVTVPSLRAYNGTLFTSGGTAVTTPIKLRFSYWNNVDFLPTDRTATGAINTGSPAYLGWTEVLQTTPNAKGAFSVSFGANGTSLLSLKTLSKSDLTNLSLQVEVKPATAPDTAYELLDVNSANPAIDRSRVQSVPFARNADLFDQHDTGTGANDIPVLEFGGRLPVSTIPGGTNSGTFIIDADNSETDEIALTFGAALDKKLSYDVSAGTFRFNDDVEIQGNLTVSGLVNGVQISQMQSATGALKAFSGGGLNLNVSHGSYRLNGTATNYAGGILALPANATRSVFFGSGGLQHSAAFPSDESYIPVAEVTTSAGSIVSIADRRTLQNDDREHERVITFHPAYEKASYQSDGADNVGQLSVSHDNIALRNFYVWTSTKTALQDYDVLIRVPVPADFVRWQTAGARNPISLQYRSTSGLSADNKLDIQIYDTAGVPVSLSGSVSNLTGTSWNTTEIEFAGSPTWTAGQEMLIRLKLSAKDNYQMHIGSLKLQLVELE